MILKRIVFAVLLLAVFFTAKAQQDTTQQITQNKYNSLAQQQKPYVVLISLDGFRWDLAEKYQATNLLKIKQTGVFAEYMKPSYPSLTFPNHYTIATGMYPSHHGLVDNIFYDKAKDVTYKNSNKVTATDSSFYGGKPLWTLAEEQEMLSAVFYWPGSEASNNGVRPTYYYKYNEVTPVENRIETVKNWLQLPANRRPHFIALYFPHVDKAAHKFTADSEQAKEAVKTVDEAVGKLMDIAKETGLPVNFVVLSDHGMAAVDNINTIPLPKAIDKNQFTVPAGTSILHLYAKDKKYIKPTYRALKTEAQDYDVYLAKRVPKRWHYNKKNDAYSRIGDMILVPRLPKVFNITGIKPEIGQHGFDPANPVMHAIFYATGPNFKTNYQIDAFENVNVYPLIADILGLPYTHKIDGKLKVLAPTLK
ncbi:MAG: alkaline phosphatase family protein [Pedobacter sp.]|nr:MAG: alkaline phosphatase family protein [Pedobacter sp.]